MDEATFITLHRHDRAVDAETAEALMPLDWAQTCARLAAQRELFRLRSAENRGPGGSFARLTDGTDKVGKLGIRDINLEALGNGKRPEAKWSDDAKHDELSGTRGTQ